MQAVAAGSSEGPVLEWPHQVRTQRLSLAHRCSLGLALLKNRLKEYLTADSTISRGLTGLAGYAAAQLFGVLGQRRREFLLLSKLHRGNYLGWANRRAERLARDATAGADHAVASLFRDHIEQAAPTPSTKTFFEHPARLLGPIAMVLKSPSAGEKGVLVLQYSYTFPLFAQKFDLEQIARRYYLVLEPSWSGYCDADILSYCSLSFPVFVQAFEPRDAAVVTATRSNLIAVPTSANWWVDDRLFRPLSGVRKDVDAIMVAGWGAYKRHHQFFSALARMRRAGHRLRVLLLGYPLGLSRDDILKQARYYRVADQLEIHERVPYEQVNEFVNRAKVNVLWSRKEGVNRAIIEGMFAGVPCVVRQGFNYGYPYPYINSQTGCFATESGLPARLLWMIENHERFAPREWVSDYMSCRRAAGRLSEVIGRTAAACGEPWTGRLAVKVNKLHNMEYWDPDDQERFAADYAFLRSTIRTNRLQDLSRPLAAALSRFT